MPDYYRGYLTVNFKDPSWHQLLRRMIESAGGTVVESNAIWTIGDGDPVNIVASPLTNQEVINAFAFVFKSSWQPKMKDAGLTLSDLTAAPKQTYEGPPLSTLPKLLYAERQALVDMAQQIIAKRK